MLSGHLLSQQLVMIYFRLVLIAFYSVLFFLVLESLGFIEKRLDLVGEKDLFLGHYFNQVSVLSILLGKKSEVLSF